MKVLLLKYWERVRASFWFLPILMATGAVLLAFATVAFDRPLTDWLGRYWSMPLTGGAEGASAVLSTIAGSMITIAGVVFSMTLVALSLASTQLGPRILRNLMRDTTMQVVLGIFVATFLYCLIVLQTIHRTDGNVFVPHLAVSLGVLFAVLDVGVLIYFIHHVSVSIQANEIVARITSELIEEIERLLPEDHGRKPLPPPAEAADTGLIDAFEWEARAIGSTGDGYLQFIDIDELLALATEKDLVLRVELRTGDYVAAGQTLVLAWPGSRVDGQTAERIHSAIILGNQRTPLQDLECAINQLVEIAVRALSPGLNDPFTAVACVDHLGSVLSRLARRQMPPSCRQDQRNQLRVMFPSFTFAELTDAAFDQIRQYGRSSVAVTIRLLETISVVAEFVHRREDLAALQRQADMIARGARQELAEIEDRRRVAERYLSACRLLREKAANG